MNNENETNYISVGTWMLIMFLTAVPLVGVIVILFGAFIGENDSRKNYFRAILAWVSIFIAFFVFLVLLGSWPEIQKHVQSLIHKS